MDVQVQQRGSLLNWAYFCQAKSVDELKQSLLLTTMELENTKLKAQEELKIRDEQIIQLKSLLTGVIKEKEEAEEKCQRLILEKILFIQQHHQSGPPHSGISSIEDEPRRGIDSNNGFSNSDCEESIVSSPVLDPIPIPLPVQIPISLPPAAEEEEDPAMLPIFQDRPLPEKGKLLQAVMKAGPLLQTLLLAGPLPQWRHPPPPLDTYQIPPPPVVVPSPPTTPTPAATANSLQQDSILPNPIAACYSSCGRINKKRGLYDGSSYSSSPTETKYQRLLLQ